MAGTITSPEATPAQALATRPRTSFANDVLKLVSGTTFAQLLAILASPILARFYAPEAFGALAIFTSITTILAVVACLRYELAIMLPESDEEAANLLAVSLFFALLISLLTVPILWFGGMPLLGLLNTPSLSTYLWLIPPAVLVSGVFLALNFWNSRTKHFGRLSIARVSQSLATVVSNLVFGFAGFATGGVLIGTSVGGQALATTVLSGQIWREDRKLFRQSVRFRYMGKGMERYKKFPMVELPGALINVIALQSPPLILTYFFSATVAGYFALATRMIQLPLSLVGASISQVFFQRASEARHDNNELARVTEITFLSLLTISMLPAIILFFFGKDIFVFVFGEAWTTAGIFVQILSPWMFFWFISSPLSTMFAIVERQDLALVLHVAVFVSRFISLVIGGLLGDVFISLILFSVSGIVVYAGIAYWNLKLAGVKQRALVSAVRGRALYCVLATIAMSMSKMLSPTLMHSIILISALLFLYYWLFARPELLRMFRRAPV